MVVSVEVPPGIDASLTVKQTKSKLAVELCPVLVHAHQVFQVLLIWVTPSGNILPHKPGNQLLVQIVEKKQCLLTLNVNTQFLDVDTHVQIDFCRKSVEKLWKVEPVENFVVDHRCKKLQVGVWVQGS